MAVSLSSPYAQVSDLQARWPGMPGDSGTQTAAGALLGDAAFWLRQWFPSQTAQYDAGTADPTGAKILSCNMVRRALQNQDNEGVASATDTQGPYSMARAFSNPDGNLYILNNEKTLIQGGDRMRSVSAAQPPGPQQSYPPDYGAIGQPGPLLWPDADLYRVQEFPNLGPVSGTP